MRTELTTANIAGRSASLGGVFAATIVKDLRIAKRYFPDLLGKIVELSVRVAFFFLLSNIMSMNAASSPLRQAMTGHNLAIFFLGALLLFVFNATALSAPVDSVTRDLHNGTLEYLYCNPSSRYAYFAGTVAANGLIDLVVFAPLFLIVVFVARPGFEAAVMMLLACIAVLVTVVAFGVMIALLAILWRQVGAIVQVLNILFEFLAGAYFPVFAFPAVIRYMAYALPQTWGYELIRYYSFRGRWETLLPVWQEWMLLGAFATVFLALSRLLLKKAEKRAKRSGLHLI
jgi:ABC-2 type transport system permease protein